MVDYYTFAHMRISREINILRPEGITANETPRTPFIAALGIFLWRKRCYVNWYGRCNIPLKPIPFFKNTRDIHVLTYINIGASNSYIHVCFNIITHSQNTNKSHLSKKTGLSCSLTYSVTNYCSAQVHHFDNNFTRYLIVAILYPKKEK